MSSRNQAQAGGSGRGARRPRCTSDWLPLPPTMQYNLPFYLQYLAKWPEYCIMAEGPARQAMGYSERAAAAAAAAVLPWLLFCCPDATLPCCDQPLAPALPLQYLARRRARARAGTVM